MVSQLLTLPGAEGRLTEGYSVDGDSLRGEECYPGGGLVSGLRGAEGAGAVDGVGWYG